MRRSTRWIVEVGCAAWTFSPVMHAGDDDGAFRRVASFPVFLNTDVDEETVAEIVTATEDGQTLIYTDSEFEVLGFVDLADPANPQPAGALPLGGEPTSVAVRGDHALACINTSADFANTSGDLAIVDIASQQIVRRLPLGGQPDAIAVSPDGRYAAVCIENERDEDLGGGEPPQHPAGFLVIVDLDGTPDQWTTRAVDLTGVATLFPDDPEPEFVDISRLNIAVVTLQENNHIVLVHLPTGLILQDFSAGTADLTLVDVEENGRIEQVASVNAVPREPDAVTWITPVTLATADEGDLFGGSRGFTTWDVLGRTMFEAQNDLEHLTARLGHYPEDRSENKGCEPESVEFGRYGQQNLLFVGSERANLVFVYELGVGIQGARFPELRQTLPTGVGPEGLLAIPSRDLFVVACEVDGRGDRIRSTIMVYERSDRSTYPSIVSVDRDDSGVPIPWGALSGMAPIGGRDQRRARVAAVSDSYYEQSRIFTIDVEDHPAVIEDELFIVDREGVLFDSLDRLKGRLDGTDDFDPASLINDDSTVNLDLEGVDRGRRGSYWVASEGAGNLVDGMSNPDDRPFESPSMLLQVRSDGEIVDVVQLPVRVIRQQLRFGFEGVVATPEFLYVCFQREWTAAGDPAGFVRIGRYDRERGRWGFAYYPIDTPTSPNGGWVGLSELSLIDDDTFAVIERDNQGGPDATIKRIYEFSTRGVRFRNASRAPNYDVIEKELVLDLIAEGSFDRTGGLFPEKLEGLAVFDRSVLIVNDNDGVDDSNGETRLLDLGDLFRRR